MFPPERLDHRFWIAEPLRECQTPSPSPTPESTPTPEERQLARRLTKILRQPANPWHDFLTAVTNEPQTLVIPIGYWDTIQLKPYVQGWLEIKTQPEQGFTLVVFQKNFTPDQPPNLLLTARWTLGQPQPTLETDNPEKGLAITNHWFDRKGRLVPALIDKGNLGYFDPNLFTEALVKI